jgi:hypothetical protein
MANPTARTLFFWPNHILSGEGEEGRSIVGVVSGSRRLGDARRLELEIGGQHRFEIDVPADTDFPCELEEPVYCAAPFIARDRVLTKRPFCR